MKLSKDKMLLYAITDRTWLGEKNLARQVEEAVRGGATFIQLREKKLAFDDFVKEAEAIKKITDAYRIPFVINDHVEVALAVDADGVHVGQDDMNASILRKRLGKDKLIGVSASTVALAKKAESEGADYLGVGAIFPTLTKNDADPVSRDTLVEICQAVSIPVVAIGGLNETNIHILKGTGVDGIALISAIFSKENIEKATMKLRKLAEETVK